MKKSTVRRLVTFAIAVIISFCFLLICSKNSPLYPMNDWGDMNCFVTVGSSIRQGKLLYSDIYEQKGPLLYFVYSFATLVSSGSFIGVFLIELVCFAAFLYFAALLAGLFHKRESHWPDIFIMAVLAFAAVNSGSFSHGGSVEEMSLFMLTASLYFTIRALKASTSVGRLPALLTGCFAAIALWTKFTICGFYLGLCIFIFFHYIKERSLRKKLVGEMLSFLAGVLIVSAPVLLYFIFNGALKSLLSAYFYNNIFVYTAKGGSFAKTLAAIPMNLIRGGLSCIRQNLPAAPLLLFAIVYYLFLRKNVKKELALLVCCAFFLLLSTFFSPTRYVYYPHVFIAFAAVGAACAVEFFGGAIAKAAAARPWLLKAGAALASCVLLASSVFINGNTYLMNYSRDELPQYRFAKIINAHPDSTLLNYGFLDSGFYFAAGKLPVTKYFCTLNVPLEEMYQELDGAVMNQTVDFIITRDLTLESRFSTGLGYQCVDTATIYFEGAQRTFRLYARSGL